MRTVLEIKESFGHASPNVWGHWFYRQPDIPVPEPYQAGEPEDICVIAGLGQRWAVVRRYSIGPFELPSPERVEACRKSTWSA